ncbi:hypothetical protein, partial [Dyadobacter sp.]|uniref:hypothetical protein n=1 Tax=Dyadobacter sp. TaxID=1914288 RepID=UPI003F713D88
MDRTVKAPPRIAATLKTISIIATGIMTEMDNLMQMCTNLYKITQITTKTKQSEFQPILYGPACLA